MAIAKAKGRLRGRAPKLDKAQEAHLVELHLEGRRTSAEIAAMFKVSRATVYRAIARAGPLSVDPLPDRTPAAPIEPPATTKPTTTGNRRRTR